MELTAPKIECVSQTLLTSVRRQEIDAGVRECVTTSEAQRVAEIERVVKELRQANEILKVPSAFSRKRSSTTDLSPRELIDNYRGTFGVEPISPICKVLQVSPSGRRRYGTRQSNPQQRYECAQRDDVLERLKSSASSRPTSQHAGLRR